MTTITITDPALIEQLVKAGQGEIRDPSGRVLALFSMKTPQLPAGMTRADVKEMREQLEAAMKNVEAEPLDETRDFKPPVGSKIPFTDEEIAEMRKRKGGRPLLEWLKEWEK